MKKIIQLSFLLFVFISVSISQLTAQNNLDKALAKAKSENKHVLLNFSGSDWCKSCIILKNNILNTDVFKEFASKNLVVLTIDFPKLKKNRLTKEQTKINESLAAKYNPKGRFPTLVIMNSNAEVLGRTNYKKLSPKEYINHLRSFIK